MAFYIEDTYSICIKQVLLAGFLIEEPSTIDNRYNRVHFHGIDAPERGQAFSAKAKELVGELAAGQTVTLRVTDTDRYERIVAEVMLPDGKNLNHEIVRAGLAWWFRRYAPRDAELERLETAARAARRGLWADAEPVGSLGVQAAVRMAPWEWQR